MCVICYKPKGANLPPKREIYAMAKTNPDGFGFVSTYHNYKSMDFDDFYYHLAQIDKKEDCIIHFRWATHGSKKLSNCHPFVKDNVWFAHNGVLPIRPIGDTTDSETTFRCHLLPVIERCNFNLDANKVSKAVNNLIGSSKFAFMYGGKVKLFGRFLPWRECLVSNYNFERFL